MELKTMRIGKICIEGIIVDSYAETQKKAKKLNVKSVLRLEWFS